jgi:CSLREA domain-containing protein
MHRIVRRLVYSLAASALILLSAGPGEAATITVDTTADDTTVNGNCTLREAVIAANTNTNVDGCAGVGAYGNDTIALPEGTYVFAIGGQDDVPYVPDAAKGDLDLLASVTIEGAGAATTIIDGNDLDKVFQISPETVTITVTINDVTIRNGTNAVSNGNGGGMDVCSGTLHLNGSVVEENSAGGRGGGIFVCSTGHLVMDSSIVRNNTAAGFGGGIAQHINDSTVAITNSTIDGNESGSVGGGIQSFWTLTISNTTISNNFAVESGGGLIHTFGMLNMTNSTLERQPYQWRRRRGGPRRGILQRTSDNVVNIKNTILAGNFRATSASDCYGTLTSQGHNLIGDVTGCTVGGDTMGNQTGSRMLGDSRPRRPIARPSPCGAFPAGGGSACKGPRAT